MVLQWNILSQRVILRYHHFEKPPVVLYHCVAGGCVGCGSALVQPGLFCSVLVPGNRFWWEKFGVLNSRALSLSLCLWWFKMSVSGPLLRFWRSSFVELVARLGASHWARHTNFNPKESGEKPLIQGDQEPQGSLIACSQRYQAVRKSSVYS